MGSRSNIDALPGSDRFLSRLLSDRSGNTLALVAASIAPLLALVGGGIDMGRSYLSENRLQQACDAGVLAARKRLGTQIVTDGLVPDAVAQAGNSFFNLNFTDGAYGTTQRTFQMTLNSDYSISGVATVAVPTTVMQIFGFDSVPITVKCGGGLNFTNTDVMMVLDTTGSMADTNPGDSQSKIAILRQVVQAFYTQLEGSKKTGTRIRYGFVPYSTNVNVGGLLKSDWMVNNWNYEGRQANGGNTGWQYRSINVDVSGLKNSNGSLPLTLGSVKVPMAGSYSAPSSLSATYRGCIEERKTYQIDDYSNVDLDKALDLNIDLVPDAKDPDTQWAPVLHDISFLRSIYMKYANGAWTLVDNFPTNNDTSTYDFLQASAYGYSVCPAAAQKLQEMTAAQVQTYVNSLTPAGSTYHDIGMIWGTRLISSTGLFASENADLPGVPTSRHLIFLTDGETAPLDLSYGTYGIEPLSQRRYDPKGSLTLTQVVENRFTVACNEAKKRRITVWIIGFGTTLNPIMTQCAGANHSFEAANATELYAAFSQIAAAMSDLRLTQ